MCVCVCVCVFVCVCVCVCDIVCVSLCVMVKCQTTGRRTHAVFGTSYITLSVHAEMCVYMSVLY